MSFEANHLPANMTNLVEYKQENCSVMTIVKSQIGPSIVVVSKRSPRFWPIIAKLVTQVVEPFFKQLHARI